MIPVKGYTRGDGTRVRAHTRGGSIAATIGALALMAVAWNATGQPMPFQGGLLGGHEGETTQASVTRILDGDTITAQDDKGRDLGRIRILGMDAPELAHDEQPAMCGADDAKDEAARLLEGHKVTLVTDTDQPNRDKYGRLLRYADITKGGSTVDITETMIRSGHAPNTSSAGTHDRHDSYAAAQDEAEERSRGLWSQCQ